MSLLLFACIVMILITPFGVHLLGYHIGQHSNQTLHLTNVKGSLLTGFNIKEVRIQNAPIKLQTVSGKLHVFSTTPSFQTHITNIQPTHTLDTIPFLNQLPTSSLNAHIDAPIWSNLPITGHLSMHGHTYHTVLSTDDRPPQNNEYQTKTLHMHYRQLANATITLKGHFYDDKDLHTLEAQYDHDNFFNVSLSGNRHQLTAQGKMHNKHFKTNLHYLNAHNQNHITLDASWKPNHFYVNNFSLHWDQISLTNQHLDTVRIHAKAQRTDHQSPQFQANAHIKSWHSASHTVENIQLHATHNETLATPLVVSVEGIANNQQHRLRAKAYGTMKQQTIHLQSEDTLSKKNDTNVSLQTTQHIQTSRDTITLYYRNTLLNQQPLHPKPVEKKIQWHANHGLTLHPIQFDSKETINDVAGTWTRQDGIRMHITANDLSLAPLFTHKIIPTGPVSLTKVSIHGKADIHIPPQGPVRINGHFAANTLQGSVDLNSIVPHLPHQSLLHFHEQQLTGTIDPQGIRIQGNVLANKSDVVSINMHINSTLDKLHETAYSLSIDGKNTQLLHNQTSNVFADIKLQLNEKNHHLHTTGNLHFKHSHFTHHKPWISHPQLPSEAVIIQSQGQKSFDDTQQKHSYSYDITLESADDNTVDVLDIYAKLQGNIRLVAHNEAPLTQGNLELKNALFRFFGTPIPIDTLSLTWHNVPIDTPDLDIELSQTLQIPSKHHKQRYGLKITGPIVKPLIDFYSEPMEMTQYEILASIMTQNHKPQKPLLDGKTHSSKLFSMIEQGLSDTQNIESSLRSLSTLKRLFIFEYIDINDKNLKPNSSSAFIHDLELTLTRKLKDNITIQLQLSPDNPDRHKLLLDAQLNQHVSVSTYVDSKGSGGVAAHFRK